MQCNLEWFYCYLHSNLMAQQICIVFIMFNAKDACVKHMRLASSSPFLQSFSMQLFDLCSCHCVRLACCNWDFLRSVYSELTWYKPERQSLKCNVAVVPAGVPDPVMHLGSPKGNTVYPIVLRKELFAFPNGTANMLTALVYRAWYNILLCNAYRDLRTHSTGQCNKSTPVLH